MNTNARDLLELCVQKDLTLAVAESCTGGLFTAALTSVPGSSRCVLGGMIAYDDRIKQEFLYIRESTLKKHGAVSRETAIEMSQNIRKLSGSDIGVAITGIAGPDGGSREKPVGLVYIAVARPGCSIQCKKCNFQGTRSAIRKQAVVEALRICLKQAKL